MTDDIDIDELKLTAYALGELDGPGFLAERLELEARLAGDEAGRRHVEEVRATARLVGAELSAAAVSGLTDLQYAAIERRLERGGRDEADSLPIRPLRRNWAMWGSLAASVVIVCTVMASVLPAIYHTGGGPSANPGGHVAVVPDAGPTPGPFATDPGTTIPVPREGSPGGGAEGYARPEWAAFPSAGPPAVNGENGFVRVADFPLSAVPTTSAWPDDAERASWAAVRRSLAGNRLPQAEAVRTDEIVNGLPYHYAAPAAGEPVAAAIEAAGCPWNAGHRLLRVGLRTADAVPAAAPATRPATRPATGPTGGPGPDGLAVQVEFNPSVVGAYRLIGYETGSFGGNGRYGADDSRRPAGPGGPVGAGRTITALYEVVPAGAVIDPASAGSSPPLKYQKLTPVPGVDREMVTVSVRRRPAGGAGSAGEARELEFTATDEGRPFAEASEDLRAAAAAAGFALVLRNSPYRGKADYDQVIDVLTPLAAGDPSGARAELLDMVRKAKSLAR